MSGFSNLENQKEAFKLTEVLVGLNRTSWLDFINVQLQIVIGFNDNVIATPWINYIFLACAFVKKGVKF